jgi:predicted RNA-binding protein YlqC (UPF0109 family)
MIKELVTFVVQQLVSHPNDVVISVTGAEEGNFFEIKVAPEDRGRVIGKEGHTIKALRTLIDTMSYDGKKNSLELSR